MANYKVVVMYDGIEDRIGCDHLLHAIQTANSQIFNRNDWLEVRIDVDEGEDAFKSIFIVRPSAIDARIYCGISRYDDGLQQRVEREGTFARFADQPASLKIVAGGVILGVMSIGVLGLAIAAIGALFVCLAG